jgi:multisubunit Na+/H+ antiporter MnhC subunit
MLTPQPNSPLQQTLLLGTVVIDVTMLGAVILYAVTEW